ncbi:MAG: MBL fold metallo-hydrolase, partial [Defluviitaleaceae bacterium]|nr:MBL fold metallo-hydrolase [Defluviitaleaceae bacterium]
EGVTVSFDDSEETSTESDKIEREFLSEPEALNKINKIIEDNPNRQLTFNYYISNIERIINIAKTCKRELVLDAYHAYVVKEVSGVNIKYYSLDAKDYGLDKSLGVNFETLINDESNYFWQLDKLALQKLDSLKSGGIYIHSNAVPLGEFDPAYKPFMESFEKQGLEVISITSTGHAKPNDLQKIIDLIKPKLLIPIHSLKPERLINNHGERLLPEKGQTI